LVLGDKTFVPGFEEQIVDMKKGDNREISVVFPADYFHKPFQNKTVKFKVKLNRLEERTVPALDAELIKKITGKEMTAEQFRAELKENMLKSREQDEKARMENEVLEQIEKNTEVELAHSLIDEEIHYMNDEQKHELEQRGISWDQYLQAVQKTEKDLHDEKHEEAEKRLRLRFGVQEVFKLEKIDVTEEELNKAFQDEMKIFAAMNYEPKLEEQEVFKTRLKNKLKMEKMVDLFRQ
jgi:trigger factor